MRLKKSELVSTLAPVVEADEDVVVEPAAVAPVENEPTAE